MSDDNNKSAADSLRIGGESPAVQIPRKHQSAPKEHWADKEMRIAAEEIVTGQFTPTVGGDDDLLDVLSVGVQRGALPAHPNDIDMNSLRQTDLLIQHPRVQEALARLAQEKDTARSTQEYLEKCQMLHELNAAANSRNQWEGQERWEGKENEQMRIGRIMTPFTFIERLRRVIGDGKVFLDGKAVLKRVAVLVPNPDPGLIIVPRADGLVRVATLQYPCGSEWMVMKFDEYGCPTVAKYLGWRTALLSLILNGIITEKEAHQAFPLVEGPASEWYQEQLYILRSQSGVPS